MSQNDVNGIALESIITVADARAALEQAVQDGRNINSDDSTLACASMSEDVHSLLLDVLAADYSGKSVHLTECVNKMLASGIISRARAIYSAAETAETKGITARLTLARSPEDLQKLASEASEMKARYAQKRATLKRIADAL